MGIIKTLASRAEKISDDERMENKEKKRLTDIFMDNGYLRYKVQETLKKKHHRKDQPRNEENKALVLPYTPGLSEDIDVSCRNLPLRIAFTSYGTFGNALTKVKTPTLPFEKRELFMLSIMNVVELVYIGETRRAFKIRMSEHKKATKNGDQNNTISVHVHSTCHAILWDKCEIHGVEENWRRIIKEAILIRTTPNTINTDPGVHINPSWNTVLPSQS